MHAQAVRNAIRAFRPTASGAWRRKSQARKDPASVWDRKHDEDLKDLLHRRPREFGKPTSLWTLALVAEVCHPKGWTTRRLSVEAIRRRPQAAGRRVEAGQALDHQPGPRLRQEKKLRDRLIAEAASKPGLGGRVPGRVLVDPAGPARPVRLGRRRPAPAGRERPGPQGRAGRRRLACYGVLRADTGGMLLRFCEGRPVSATTEEFLGWVCGKLAARGEEGVRPGVGQRRVARQQAGPAVDRAAQPAGAADRAGCRIRVCGLPVKAPWLNAIEPKWVHGKRAIVEPDRKLTADELRQRACDYFGCPNDPPLPKPAT